ncbi:MAG TPA: LysM peptidoglycan-binding domain-containing protein [Polyangiaceae bacterium]|jgi:phage tail protein X|nr:LysM peptidoglycan-binding domain-containing protein [Polyangiaceae bacterium]
MREPRARGRGRLLATAAVALGLVAASAPARAFTVIVSPGDTLASLAERYYGRIQQERLLVAANFLDARGGTPIVPGMRLEIPALGHHRIAHGETWETLAAELLGAPSRADVLSIANGSSPWLAPEDGSEIAIPYNLRVVVGEHEELGAIAYRHLGDMNKAWTLDHYNGLGGKKPVPGEVLLLPLTDLALTEAGQKAAAASASDSCGEAGGAVRRTQQHIAQEIPALVADVRAGRYTEAVARGVRFVASGALTEPQRALVEQKLTEAYVALDAVGLAAASCAEWRKRDRGVHLDPIVTSPKIIAACERATP